MQERAERHRAGPRVGSVAHPPRAPHGAAPCRGVYHHLAGHPPEDRADRDALRRRLQRALPRPRFAAARGYGFLGWNTRFAGDGHRFILEHALIDIGVGVRWLREPRGRRKRRAARELRWRVAHGRVPVASGRAEPAADAVGRPPRRRPRPPAGRRARRAVRASRPTRRAHRVARSLGDRRVRSAVARPVARHVRSRRTALPTHPTSSSATAPPSTRANERITDWVFEEHERLVASGGSERVSSRCSARGPISASSTSPSTRHRGDSVATSATRGPRTTWGRALPTCARCGRGSRCGACPRRSAGRGLTSRAFATRRVVIEATDDRGCYPSDAAQIFDDLASTDKRQAVLTADHYLRHPADARDQAADLIAGWLEEHKW